MAEFSQIVNSFAVDIYQNCIAGKKENVILSPFSIQTALSLVLMGAKGKTAEEMNAVMKYAGISREEIANHFDALTASLDGNTSVKVANKIYVQKNYTVKKEFNDLAVKQFRSEAESLNFGDSDPSAKAINSWVESKTNNKIQNLIESSMLTDDTRMVLVNAIYFKGLWEHQFHKENTRPGKFWLTNDESVEVPFMFNNKKYNFAHFKDLEASALEMKYKDSDISMFIILPDKRDGLAELEAKLNTINIGDLSKNMYNMEVNVTLPKFKVEFQVGLKEILSKMGMSTMFSNMADFSDLLEQPEPLQVSDVIHKAFIEVNEEGAEAAAATGVIMMTRSLRIPDPPKDFVADHPFYYILFNKKLAQTYFNGRLCQR